MHTGLKKKEILFPIIGVALAAFLLGFFGRNLFSGTGVGLSGAAGTIADMATCDTSSLLGKDPTGIVLADPLNLRTGPGLNYQIITMLEICRSVKLIGRTSDSAWLEISLPGNVGGWVFSGYIQANMKIGDLKVTTAAGGPTTNTSPGGGGGSRYISVVIQGNQAAAFVNGMPANKTINATLSPSTGSGKALVVASGTTDAQGNITLTFPFPTTWSDGSAIKSGSMTLTVTGGGATLSALLTYSTN